MVRRSPPAAAVTAKTSDDRASPLVIEWHSPQRIAGHGTFMRNLSLGSGRRRTKFYKGTINGISR
jgi:hypothetical protein